MLKVGVVGVGGISGAHIAAWDKVENAELVALCDIRPEQMDQYENVNKYTDFEAMLDAENLDIVDICLPTFLHADYAVKALERGINTVCEKPISLKKDDVKRVYDTAEKHGVKFMVAQVLRFWPEFELVRSIYQDGRYGRLLSGTMMRLGNCPDWTWNHWMKDEKLSGLVPFDLHIHDLDFLVYTFGKPQSVLSRRSKLPNQDHISMVYDYEEFSITAESAWYAAPYPFMGEFRFQFENAVVAYEGGKVTIYEVGGNILKQDDEAAGDTGSINLPQSDAFQIELSYFAECVEKNEPVTKVKASELEAVIELLNTL